MDSSQTSWIANFLWSNAGTIRDAFKGTFKACPTYKEAA